MAFDPVRLELVKNGIGTVVQVAWGIVLAKLTSQRDVVFGSTVSGRPAEVDGVKVTGTWRSRTGTEPCRRRATDCGASASASRSVG